MKPKKELFLFRENTYYLRHRGTGGHEGPLRVRRTLDKGVPMGGLGRGFLGAGAGFWGRGSRFLGREAALVKPKKGVFLL